MLKPIKLMKTAAAAAAAALSLALYAAPATAADATHPELAAKLPADIQSAGVIKNGVIGTFSPYTITNADRSITGATMDIISHLEKILGVKIQTTALAGHTATMLALTSGRIDASIEPVGDYPDREANYDFVDYVKEYVVFLVPKGNPKGIKDIADTCGLRVSVMAAGSAERVIKKQSEVCRQQGKPAVTVLSFEGQAAPTLAVASGRADAFFSSQAPLTYFSKQNDGKFELAAVGRANGFDDIFQGIALKKGSPLGPVLLDAMKVLFENGTYAEIMKKYGLDANMIDAPGMNLATAKKAAK